MSFNNYISKPTVISLSFFFLNENKQSRVKTHSETKVYLGRGKVSSSGRVTQKRGFLLNEVTVNSILNYIYRIYLPTN